MIRWCGEIRKFAGIGWSWLMQERVTGDCCERPLSCSGLIDRCCWWWRDRKRNEKTVCLGGSSDKPTFLLIFVRSRLGEKCLKLCSRSMFCFDQRLALKIGRCLQNHGYFVGEINNALNTPMKHHSVESLKNWPSLFVLNVPLEVKQTLSKMDTIVPSSLFVQITVRIVLYACGVWMYPL